MTPTIEPFGTSIRKPDSLIVWIRRELRVQDHLALWSAASDARSVIPLYILDSAFPLCAPARQRVILDGLGELRAALKSIGGMLFVRTGEPASILHSLLRETGAAGVYCTKEYHPAVRFRDGQIRSSVEASGRIWREFKDQVLFDDREILSKSRSEPFTVFTAYRNAWKDRQQEILPPLPILKRLTVPVLPAGELPCGQAGARTNPVGGEREAERSLKQFLRERLTAYHADRDLPGLEGTSRLSHHFASGSLSVRTAYDALNNAASPVRGLARQGSETFLNEIIWREFYYQILANFPHVVNGAFKPAFDRLAWSDDAAHIGAWMNGTTGYPIVDAAMRQLNTEGWMHNRSRMIVANFLTKDLHVDWRIGEEYFMRRLADGDVALNNGGWQWSAGTGNDAQPWFRIFNPVLQSKKFDPRGAYIRRYLPELGLVPDRYIHEPWLMPPGVQGDAGCRIGKEYPTPVVEHDVERRRTLEIYGRIASERRPAQGKRQTEFTL